MFGVNDGQKLQAESEEIITKIITKYGAKSCLVYRSSTKKEIFLEFRPTLKEIQVKADRDNLPFLLDEGELIERATAGNPSKNIASFTLGDNPHVTKFRPVQHIYGKSILFLFCNPK